MDISQHKMASGTSTKKPKLTSGSGKSEETDLIKAFEEKRKNAAESILDFKFNMKRVRILTSAQDLPDRAEGVVYWMFRDQRVQDNWAVLFAQKLALENEIPLHICFCLKKKFLDASLRHFKFLLQGLEEIQVECKSLDIEFHLLIGNGEDVLPGFVEKNNIGAVVVDFMPIREYVNWIDKLKKSLPKDVPVYQVDAHNIVPCWEASDKLENGPRTIRGKITRQLPEFMTEFPPVIKHPFSGKLKAADKIDWEAAEKQLTVDRSVGPVSITPGYKAGISTLQQFCEKRIKLFVPKRHDPTVDALSNLSPYIHFGQISPQRAILYINDLSKSHKEAVDAFVEEAVVRRELSDNFCFFNKKYDSVDGAFDWAKKTLNDHKKDKRAYLYTRSELEESKTHDDLWNSAQIQLIQDAKLHYYLRIYWAKKILEWSATPEEALATAIYLNDKYNMDGRDPNGFVGCMWSICGVHDQAGKEREIFGKIRYMDYEECKKTFDVPAFVTRYGGKVHKYTKKQ